MTKNEADEEINPVARDETMMEILGQEEEEEEKNAGGDGG